MTDKTEAQPEALRLADLYTAENWPGDLSLNKWALSAATELRRQHAEIEQLKSQFEPTIEDNSQDWARCDPAVAFHLIDRHAENWADAGKMMTEFADAKAEIKLKASRDELTTQTNRAAAAEQQVTALTQRLDTANALNTEAREQLAQLSARQAVPDGWRLVPVGPTEEMIKAGNAKTWVLPCGDCWSAMLSAAPPPPEREPHPPTRHCMCADCAPSFNGASDD